MNNRSYPSDSTVDSRFGCVRLRELGPSATEVPYNKSFKRTLDRGLLALPLQSAAVNRRLTLR